MPRCLRIARTSAITRSSSAYNSVPSRRDGAYGVGASPFVCHHPRPNRGLGQPNEAADMNIADAADGRSLPPEIVLRNRLSELFLEALADPERGAYVLWLRTYCRLAGPAHWQVAFPVLAEVVSREAANYPGADHRGPLEALLADFDLFQLRHLEDDHAWRGPEALEALRWSWQDTIELYPEFRECWMYVVQRAERYWTVVGQLMQQHGRMKGGVKGAVAQGVRVFNAGLFFEYHELIEDHWRAETGDRKRFLQGLIQVAVG